MLEKNKDPVSEDLLVILKGSDDQCVTPHSNPNSERLTLNF